MIDGYKVIKGLECCTQHGSMCGRDCNGHWGWTDGSHTGMELLGEYRTKCPYGNCETGCVKTLAHDALELLKEQEPRVMTLEEIKRLAPDDDVWIEYHELAGWTISAVTVREIYDNGMLCRLQNVRFNFGRYGCYGGDWLAWRCWTSRPTDEQRKAVKWGWLT